MSEKWKKIEGFDYYEVSNLGNVRKLLPFGRTHQRTVSMDRGHNVIQIKQDGICHSLRISRLVGAAFCKDFKQEFRPIFKDGNKANCQALNLKWVPVSQVTGIPYSRNPKIKYS